MKQKEIKIGLSSTLLAVIDANPETYDLLEIATQIKDHVSILEELRRRDPSRYKILIVVYAIIDRVMAETEKEQAISCRRGCSFCCRMNVDVTPMEVDLIIDYCRRNDILIDDEYLRRQALIPKMELGFSPALSSCVFLSKENTCSIYPARPLACRKYVVKTPAELCNLKKYPHAQIGAFVDVNAEILTSALDTIQNGDIDSLPKMLLKQLGQNF